MILSLQDILFRRHLETLHLIASLQGMDDQIGMARDKMLQNGVDGSILESILMTPFPDDSSGHLYEDV